MSSKLSFNTINKRSRCINTQSSNDTKTQEKFTNVMSLLNDNSSISTTISVSTKSFMESLLNTQSASKFYNLPFIIIEKLIDIDNMKLADDLVSMYASQIVPYVDNLKGILEYLHRYTLTENQKKIITDSVNEYIVADRILINHNSISHRFNIETEYCKLRARGLKEVVEFCVRMIDTYDLAAYKKLNICIEELTYLFGKYGDSFDSGLMVEYLMRYFLLMYKYLSFKDLQNYRKVLEESACLEKEDLNNVQYLYQSFTNVDFDDVNSYINAFLVSHEKSIEGLENTIAHCMNCRFGSINANFDKLLLLLWDIYKLDLFGDEIESVYRNNFEIMSSSMIQNIEEFVNGLAKTYTKDILDKIALVRSQINIISSMDCKEYCEKVVYFSHLLDNMNADLTDLYNRLYDITNLSEIEFVNSENSNCISLNEFKIFKFHNLVKAAMNLDNFLKIKSRKMYEKGANKTRKIMKKVKDVLFGESTNIYEYIGEDSKVDICVAQYYIDENSLPEIHQFFAEVCKEFNDRLVVENNTARCYYIINPGIAEIHIKESTMISMEENDWELVKKSNIPELDVYIEELATLESFNELYENIIEEDGPINIDSKITNLTNASNLSLEHFEIALEALSLLNMSKNDIEIFGEKFSNYRYNCILESGSENNFKIESKKIDSLVEHWNPEQDVPMDIQLEAYQILCAVLESSDNQNKDKKNPFSGINMNSIKLYLEGLKSKFKDLDQKQKELCRNTDNTVRRLVKAMHDALISDRREAIIKGSVIPSFSKCVKICIALAGIAKFASPMAAICIAVGGFAMSKKLTKKERILLLDEIETELEVVEKEISMAESKNQMKKYRALLKYKKDLQRQYQRIRYNVRVGKDILPNSTAGIKNYNQ